MSNQTADERPVEPEFISAGRYRYRGRDFYGERADVLAEVVYLRDLAAWYERQLRGFRAWSASVNEALNSGEGSYRP